MPKQSIPREHRKNEILRIANKLFVKRGYDGVSLQEIANAVGIKKSSVFFHYENKEMLACEAIRSLTRFISREIGEVIKSHCFAMNNRQIHFSEFIITILKEHIELAAPIYLSVADSPMIQSVSQSYFDSWISILKEINGENWAVSALSMLLGSFFLYNLYDDEKALKVLARVLKPGVL